MDYSQLLVANYPCTALFADIFIPILSFHVFSREYALLELKIDAVLGEHFGVELTFNLLDELIDGVAKNEVTFESWVSMEIKVHEESFVFGVMFAKFLYGEAGRLLFGVWIAVIAV